MSALHVYLGSCACIAGIVLGHIFPIGWSVIVLCGVFSVLLLTFRCARPVVLICICALAIGYARMYWVITHIDRSLDATVGQTSALEGVIASDPDVRASVTHYVLDVDMSEEHVRMTARHQPEFAYGDRVRVTGVLEFPENFSNEYGLVFNYIGFLAKDGMRYTIFFPKVEHLSSGEGNRIRAMLIRFKQWFVDSLTHTVKEPAGALAGGILLGTKQSLGEAMLTAFRRSGLIHIVVLSGFNVTIIADAIRRVFQRLPPSTSMVMSIISIALFAVMTGASATTVRASIMAILAVIALRQASVYNVNRALAVAAVLMSLHNPQIVLFDPGFQLSFIATIGLIHWSPKIEQWLPWISERFGLRQIIATTIATQLAVLPLLIYMTGEVSVVALAANVLVLPAVSFAMALSALAVPAQWLGLFGMPIIVVAHAALAYMLAVASFFGALPFATVPLLPRVGL